MKLRLSTTIYAVNINKKKDTFKNLVKTIIGN